MGAGASFDTAMESSLRRQSPSVNYYCHGCSFMFSGSRPVGEELMCPRCDSVFLEECVQRDMPTNSMFGMSFHRGLNHDQSRRLMNASIMLRLLEAELRQELELLQLAYSTAQTAQKEPEGLSNIMHEKLRRPKADVDMICSQPSCPICSDDFAPDVDTLQMPCSHIFHEDCVMPWLSAKRNCPICRYELNDSVSTVEELERFSKGELVDMYGKVSRSTSTEGEAAVPVEQENLEDKSKRDIAVMLHSIMSTKAAEAKTIETEAAATATAAATAHDSLVPVNSSELRESFFSPFYSSDSSSSLDARHFSLFPHRHESMGMISASERSLEEEMSILSQMRTRPRYTSIMGSGIDRHHFEEQSDDTDEID